VVRGFDAMHTLSAAGRSYALCACDGAVPYTTSILVSSRYDGAAGRLPLGRGFRGKGVPVVLRKERPSSQPRPPLGDLLEALGVITLHGPPYHARFYGQLERQNRERRSWLRTLDCPSEDELVSELERCRVLLNTQLMRRSLDWCTAEARWCQRLSLA